MTLRPSSLVLLSFFLACPCSAIAQEQNAQNNSAPLDTLAVFDEVSYAWPGDANSNGKPLVDSISVRPGLAASPLMPFGDCAYVDSSAPNGQTIPLSFKTRKEWSSLKSAPPEFVTLTPGCRRTAIENPCGGKNKILMASRAGTFKTLAFSPHLVGVFQCVASGDARAKWTLTGENIQAARCSSKAKTPKEATPTSANP